MKRIIILLAIMSGLVASLSQVFIANTAGIYPGYRVVKRVSVEIIGGTNIQMTAEFHLMTYDTNGSPILDQQLKSITISSTNLESDLISVGLPNGKTLLTGFDKIFQTEWTNNLSK